MLQSETKEYLRYSSWRVARTIAQIITNLGGEFKNDQLFLELTEDIKYYTPGFREDHKTGDDPYRYYRW